MTTSFKRWAIDTMGKQTPERLWLHYVVVLSLVISLLVGLGATNRALVEQKQIAAETLKKSVSQLVLSQQVVALSIAHSTGTAANLHVIEKRVRQLESAHLDLINGNIWSDTLQQHYFDGLDPLHAQVREFVDLAHLYGTTNTVTDGQILARMAALNAEPALMGGLNRAIALFEQEAETRAGRIIHLQRSIQAAFLLVMICAGAVLVLPTQSRISTTMQLLRERTKSLESSQIQLKRMNHRLQHQLNHDTLTGLPNRRFVMGRIRDILDERPTTDVGILFIGLDNFKAINDTAGHDIGDAILNAFADMLQTCVDIEDTVGRIGGDEFVILTCEAAEMVAQRILQTWSDAIDIEGRPFVVRYSIGYLTVDPADNDQFQIIANAGIALQAAKNAGGGRSQDFTPDLRESVERLQQLRADLPGAIAAGQIEPWFQPQVSLVDGTLRGVEVLARWRHPSLGLLTPDRFLPAAEKAGLIVDMDHAIWAAAMDHARGWQEAGLWYPCVSLNAAPDTIADPNLLERFLLHLQRANLDVGQVVIEVLETTLIDGADDMAAINIDSLAECGVALELDDFGTGYASLSKLTQLPLSGIKLDRSLIAPLPDPGADSLVRAIVALASELGMHVVAEGIEEEVQARHLIESGCAFGQGYGFARPMPTPAFGVWLRDTATKPRKSGDIGVQIPMRA